MTSPDGGHDDRARRLERQLSIAQEITHIGSWEWDVATNVVSWSDELYRIYGLVPGLHEITFEFFLSRLVPDDRERVRGEVQDALARGGRFSYLERIARPDGSIRYLDTVGEVAVDADGNPAALIGTCRDVTDERKRESRLRLHEEIVRNVQIALYVWQADENDARNPATLRLVTANAAAERLTGMALAERRGELLHRLFPVVVGGEMDALLRAVLEDGEVRAVTAVRFPNGTHAEQFYDLKVFPLSDRCLGIAAEDVTATTRARDLQSSARAVLEMVAASAPLERVLDAIARAIERQAPGVLASILLLDPDGVHLRHGAAPSLPDAFNRAVDGAEIGPMHGSCGTSAYERVPVIVPDVESDPRWANYLDLARIGGIRACWSTPLIGSAGQVIGTFALYASDVHEPTESERELTTRFVYITQIAIQRRQLDDQLRALTGHIEAAREDERTGIAREIHDELGQSLTAIKLDVAWIARQGRSAENPALMERVRSINETVDELITRVRRISSELRPGALDDLGLVAAAEWQCREFERRAGTKCVLESSVTTTAIERELATGFFRILQECLTNVARHANASRVDVRLEQTGGRLVLTVQDDGKGISRHEMTSPKSLGLLGMNERARRLGGVLRFETPDTGGTLVRVESPPIAE